LLRVRFCGAGFRGDFFNQEVGDFGFDASVRLAIEQDRGGLSAVANAVDGLEGKVVIGRRLPESHPKTFFDVRDKTIATPGPAKLRAAHAQRMAGGWVKGQTGTRTQG
jgi:hypothetical protein